VYYVNCLAGAQGVFNRQLVIALTTLVSDLDRDGRVDLADEVVMLRQEIAELRSRVVALQTASDSPDCNHEAPR
jgi:hypothetical protein